ncbi:ATPase [Selenomonadales bacterium OttesenSCG-928-I06]|nr:ATPase [Selenomonadales bacterium OttesenSCG-928-I06]
MSIEKLLDDMENMLLDSTRVPLTNKRVIEEDEIAEFIDEIREILPKEIFEARKIVAERNKILEDAQKESQNIIEQAKSYVAKLTDEHAIAKHAEEQAKIIINEANISAEELKLNSVTYAKDVFDYLSGSVERTLESIYKVKHDFERQQQIDDNK